MENVEFYTLEMSSASRPGFSPCTKDGEVEHFDSLSSAIAACPYYSCFRSSDCVIRVVRHVHFSQVSCEVSKLNEPINFECYGSKD